MTDDWRTAYRGRRVLVTGALGFIGGHVAATLAAAGAEVVTTSRGAGGTVQVDLSEPGTGAAVIAAHRPAIVFNLAGYGVDPAERAVAAAERINTELPAELAQAMATVPDPAWPGQHVVHAGTALEYGTAAGDLREDTPCRPTTLYGTTKEAGTRRLLAAAAGHGVRATVARLFTVYGPGEHAGRLLPTLRGAAGSAAAIPLTAGTQRRDFTWVGDVVEGMLRLGALPHRDVGIVNVATGRLITVREFVERSAAVLGIAPTRLAFGALPTRPEEMQHDDVRIARLEELTGWRPSTAIAEGVRRTAEAG